MSIAHFKDSRVIYMLKLFFFHLIVKMLRFRAKAHQVFHCFLYKKSPFAMDVRYLPYSTPFLIFSSPLLSAAFSIQDWCTIF